MKHDGERDGEHRDHRQQELRHQAGRRLASEEAGAAWAPRARPSDGHHEVEDPGPLALLQPARVLPHGVITGL